MYPGNQQYIVTYASGQPVMATAYPPRITPHYVLYAENYPSQAGISQPGGGAHIDFSTPCHANQVAATEASVAGSTQGTASATYPGQGAPPTYQEKQQPAHES